MKQPRSKAQPEWLPPMLATLSDRIPAGSDWIFEPKLDGVRCLVFVRDGAVRLVSRNRKPMNAAYPELVEALETAVRGDAVLDGEVVAVDPSTGGASFALLQQRMHVLRPTDALRSGVRVELWLFDCLHFDGHDLTPLPLVERKTVLRDIVWYDDRIRFTPFRTRGGTAMYRQACSRGAEGIIAKRADAPYSGARSPLWVKVKCVNEQEFVVGGWTDPKGGRSGFGALLLGYYERGRFRYAGKVGTGFDGRALELIHDALRKIERRTSPFSGAAPEGNDVHWCTPALVAQVGYAEWTPGGLLRHPRFVGLRTDKEPKAVGAT